MRRSVRTPPVRQCGIALVAVLWIVAALSVMVTSMSHSVRHEIRSVSSARQAAVGQALGQAAIHLLLQDMAAQATKPQTLVHVDTTFRDTAMRVRVLPLTGQIDINNAPLALLTALFTYAGQVNPQQAGALAAACIEARSAKDARGRAVGFEAPEDLLRVPGVDYTLYARLLPLVTADLQGGGRVNPLAAPEPVLLVLAGGNAVRAASIAAEREAGKAGIDTTALSGELMDGNANTQRFHLQARVPLPSGAWLLVSRIVDFGGGYNGLQWRTIHSGIQFEAVPGERI